MTRIPVLSRDEMRPAQQTVHDQVLASTGRIGSGPAVGYAWSPGLWRLHNESSAHLLDCSLTPAQVRLVSLVTARHWNAAYPWSAQAPMALEAGIAPDAVEAINDGRRPDLPDPIDTAVYDTAHDLLHTGNLDAAAFKTAEEKLGYERLADVIGVIGHFTTTGMMANAVGAEARPDAVSTLKT